MLPGLVLATAQLPGFHWQLLVGDTFWRALNRTPDVKAEVDEMSKAVGFRMGKIAEKFFIFDGIDDRNIVKFPLPQRFKTIAISFGASDLLDPKGTALSAFMGLKLYNQLNLIVHSWCGHRPENLIKPFECIIVLGLS